MITIQKQTNWFQGEILQTHTGTYRFIGFVPRTGLHFTSLDGRMEFWFPAKQVDEMINAGEWRKI